MSATSTSERSNSEDSPSNPCLTEVLRNCANIQSLESLNYEYNDVLLTEPNEGKMITPNPYSFSGNISISSGPSEDVSFTESILEDNGRISLAYENLKTIPRRLADKFAAQTKFLDLSHNDFRNLRFLSFFEDLDTLILDRNVNLDINTFPYLPSLRILWWLPRILHKLVHAITSIVFVLQDQQLRYSKYNRLDTPHRTAVSCAGSALLHGKSWHPHSFRGPRTPRVYTTGASPAKIPRWTSDQQECSSCDAVFLTRTGSGLHQQFGEASTRIRTHFQGHLPAKAFQKIAQRTDVRQRLLHKLKYYAEGGRGIPLIAFCPIVGLFLTVRWIISAALAALQSSIAPTVLCK
nr:uncharacterized protein LOC6727766 isoform X1 [Drosophila simulans]